MKIKTTFFFLLALLTVTTFTTAPRTLAAEDLFPRAASLKRSEVYVRSGPGTRYPILWVFQRKGWPITLLNKYDNWFKIRDVEGEEGWVYVGMVSSAKTGIVSPGEPIFLTKRPNGDGNILRLAANVIVSIEDCPESRACRINYNDKVGYVPADRILRPQE